MSNLSGHPVLQLPGFDSIVDLVGNPVGADLHLFLNGNQFMVMPALLKAFQDQHPEYRQIFYETLPPGLLAQQIVAHGEIAIGSLQLVVLPDIYAAGRAEMQDLQHALLEPQPYAANRLALLVRPDNPKQIRGFHDLGRDDVRIAMPNPATEGIARLARHALVLAGGEPLAETVFEHKQQTGSTLVTTVHHRETIAWLENHRVDVGVVWQSEAAWASHTGRNVTEVPLEDFSANPVGQYYVAGVQNAPHPQARDAFLAFLLGSVAQRLYQHYGFFPPSSHHQPYRGF